MNPLEPSAADYAAAGIFGKYVIRLNEDFTVLANVTAMIIVMINGFMLLQLNAIHFFITTRTQIPALFYMLLCSTLPSGTRFMPALIASSLLILLLFRIFSAYKKESLSYNFLDAGFLISLAGFFYVPAILFYPFLLIAMNIIRPFVWREWVFSLIGLLLPFLFLFAAYFLADASIANFADDMSDAFKVEQFADAGMGSKVFAGYVALLILISSVRMIRVVDNIKIQYRKIFISFFWMFIVTIVIFFAVPASGVEMICFTAVPVSFLLAYYFAHCRQNWANNALLMLYFLSIIIVKLFG
ncbi:MAG: hypothetical protein JXB19_11315 [Bacteroidales bacterium]|nr:hypothetical protein [Bacteroidales bacterium]